MPRFMAAPLLIDTMVGNTGRVRFLFAGEVIYWRGPSPYHFVPLPPAEAAEIRSVANLVTYGWGVIPVRARIGDTEFETSLFPTARRLPAAGP